MAEQFLRPLDLAQSDNQVEPIPANYTRLQAKKDGKLYFKSAQTEQVINKVTSVNGQDGDVVLKPQDVGLPNIQNPITPIIIKSLNVNYSNAVTTILTLPIAAGAIDSNKAFSFELFGNILKTVALTNASMSVSVLHDGITLATATLSLGANSFATRGFTSKGIIVLTKTADGFTSEAAIDLVNATLAPTVSNNTTTKTVLNSQSSTITVVISTTNAGANGTVRQSFLKEL